MGAAVHRDLFTVAGAITVPMFGVPMLAQMTTPSAADFGAWMLSAACFVVIVRQVVGIVQSFREWTREKPEPSATYQPRVVCEKISGGLKDLMETRTQATTDALREMKQSINALSMRIDGLLARWGGRAQ